MTDISVLSALMRVRWKDIPVRRDESSTEMRSGSDLEVTRSDSVPLSMDSLEQV